MRVYADSSALIKRGVVEPESLALRRALTEFSAADDVIISSTLAWVETSRSIRSRMDDADPVEVAELIETAMSGILECPITEQVIGIARRLGPSTLRSLDAIHLATASLLDARVICGYDDRMLRAAHELGFRTVSPS